MAIKLLVGRSFVSVFFALVSFHCVTAMPIQAQAQEPREPDQTPFLMLDNGMHVGLIYRLSVDGAGAKLATSSTDKSIRVWDLASGQAITRVHVPVGLGEIGAVYSVALTPNGKYLLAASQSFDTEAEFVKGSVYFFKVENGKIIGRIPELPANVTHIAVSGDGKRFALVMGKWGFELRSAKGKKIFADRDINDPVEWLSFGPKGLFASVSRAGDLRIYAEQEDKVLWIDSRHLPEGLVPYSVAYSPDGRRLAVGYANAPRVDVLSSDTLETIEVLEPRGLSGDNLGAVAWAEEETGLWLYAAGTAKNETGRNVVIAWQHGRAQRQASIAVADDSITHLQGVPGGGVVFASSEPAWGHVVLEDGAKSLGLRAGQTSRAVNFRTTARQGLAVSADGASIIVPPAVRGGPPTVFDLRKLTQSEIPNDAAAHRSADTSGAPIEPRKWYGSKQLSIAGRSVPLFPRERVLSGDFDPNKNVVLLGTDYYLRLHDAAGKELATRRLTAPAWGVVIARDHSVAVAALGDGTVRWYSLRADLPLAELAGFALHADRQRWVAWTADGLFAHSDLGGEAMVGYFRNGTLKSLTGRWISFEQVYRLFYDPKAVSSLIDTVDLWPDVVERRRIESILASLSLPQVALESYCVLTEIPTEQEKRGLVMVEAEEDPAIEDEPSDLADSSEACFPVSAVEHGFANAHEVAAEGIGATLPPKARAVRLQVRVTDLGGGIGDVDAFLNGRNFGRFTPQANLEAAGGVQSANGGDGARSLVYERVIPVYGGQNDVVVRAYNDVGIFVASQPIYFTVPSPDEVDGKPMLHVLGVGINQYAGRINPLLYAVNDAQSFADKIEAVKPDRYGGVAKVTLLDGDATRDRIEAELVRLSEEAGPSDAVLIYLAGHGISDSQGNYFFVPIDVEHVDAVSKDGLGHQRLIELLSSIYARNVFVFLDTCYSGAFELDPYGPGSLAQETGRYVLTASTSFEEALDSYDNVNGVFAKAVLLGLESTSNGSEGIVDALELGLSVRRQVPNLAKENDFSQSAVFKAAGGDLLEFPIAQP